MEEFASPEALPERAFFPKAYLQQYRRQLNELINRMERLVEEEDNLETDSDAAELEWNGAQLAALPGQTVWHNLRALRDCRVLLEDAAAQFTLKIRESAELVAAEPQLLALERTPSSSSMPVSEYSSDDALEEEEADDALDEFQDVEPVRGRKAAVALNNDVTARVQSALRDEDEFERFKANALQFGMGNESAERFYAYLAQHIPAPVLDSIVVDFARLLPQAALRMPLLKEHYQHMKNELARPSMAHFRNKSYSMAITSRSSTSSSAWPLVGAFEGTVGI